jgi:hypothetical protein
MPSRADISSIQRVFSSISHVARDEASRVHRHDFSRQGLLSPEFLTLLLLYMIADAGRRGYQQLLIEFWDEAQQAGLRIPQEDPVAAPSFSDARAKLSPDALQIMTAEVVKLVSGRSGPAHLWHGRRLVAVDGSKVNLRRHPELAREFGVPSGAHNPQALASVLYDVMGHVPIDWRFGPFKGDERADLVDLLSSCESGDLLLLDRGYPSHDVFSALEDAGLDYLARVSDLNTFAAVERFKESGKEDAWVTFTPPSGQADPYVSRIIRSRSPSGEDQYFVTNLRSEEVSASEIRDLYRMRWETEEFYKLAKSNYIGQGQFRSKSAHGVRQEFAAEMLYLAISELVLLMAKQQEGPRADAPQRKGAVLALARYITRLALLPDSEALGKTLDSLLRRVQRARYRKRKGRSFPRRSFVPTPKWGPAGRKGA